MAGGDGSRDRRERGMSPDGRMRCLIVDDEPLARRKLSNWLRLEADLDLCGECGSAEEAEAALRQHSPELVFLDIRMPGASGIELAEQLARAGGKAPQVVFVTAHDRHAVRAFDLCATDYLLKPYTRRRLLQALARVRLARGATAEGAGLQEVLGMIRVLEHESGLDWIQRIALPGRGRIRFIDCERLLLAQADGNYVRLYTEKEQHLLRSSLGGLEERLNPAEFRRVHRSALVRLDAIESAESLGRGDMLLRLRGGREVLASRRYRDRLKDLAGPGPKGLREGE